MDEVKHEARQWGNKMSKKHNTQWGAQNLKNEPREDQASRKV